MIDPIEDLRQTLFDARLCCDAWWTLIGAHPQRETIVRGFESFPVLFETLRPALFTSFVVKICSTFGNGRGEITLRDLPNVQQDPDFIRVWDRGRTLYRYRSKVLAHRDASKDPDTVAKEIGFSHDDLRALMDDVHALFDRAVRPLGKPGIPDIDCEEELWEAAKRMARPPDS